MDLKPFTLALPRHKLYSGNAHDRRKRRRKLQRTSMLTITLQTDTTPSVRETFKNWVKFAHDGQREYEGMLRSLPSDEVILYPVSPISFDDQ